MLLLKTLEQLHILLSSQNSFSGGKRKGSLRLSKKLPFFKMKDGSPDEEKEGKTCFY